MEMPAVERYDYKQNPKRFNRLPVLTYDAAVLRILTLLLRIVDEYNSSIFNQSVVRVFLKCQLYVRK